MSFLFSPCYLAMQVFIIGAVSDFLLILIIVLADSSPLRRRPWQSSFPRLQELLSIGSRCLGWRFLFFNWYIYKIWCCHFWVYACNNDIASFSHPNPNYLSKCLILLSAWSGFGWDLCHFARLQWSGSSSLRSCKFRTYKGKLISISKKTREFSSFLCRQLFSQLFRCIWCLSLINIHNIFNRLQRSLKIVHLGSGNVGALKFSPCFQLEMEGQLSLFTHRWIQMVVILSFFCYLQMNLLVLRKNFKLLQTFAPTTLAPARDFWTLRYTTSLDNGSLVVSMPFIVKYSIMWDSTLVLLIDNN